MLLETIYGARRYVVPPLDSKEEWRTVMEAATDGMSPAQAMNVAPGEAFTAALKGSNNPAALSCVAALKAYASVQRLSLFDYLNG